MTDSLGRREFLKQSAFAAAAFSTSRHGVLPSGSHGRAPERRDRAWLVRYLSQPIADTTRNSQYLELINHSIDHHHLTLDTNWLQHGGRGGNPRRQTTVMGLLSFCYRTKGLRGYQDPQLLAELRLAYLAVADHITAEGRFDWPGIRINYDASPGRAWPEHAWSLESMLIGYLWVGEKFPPADQRTIEAALQRATTWLFEHPNTELNNRGVVHCAVNQLCALFYDRRDYADIARRSADRVISAVVFTDGECGEHSPAYAGGGPDSDYSYTAWAYVYFYRLLSGDSDLDPRLLQACRWFSMYHTLSGCPNVVGASVRTRYVNNSNFPDLLPAYERYARSEPFFSVVAEKALDKIYRTMTGFWEDLHRWGEGGHLINPVIWALLEQGPETQSLSMPEWYAGFTEMYERPQVQYALVGRQYQTGVVVRGRKGAPTGAGDEHAIPPGGFPLRGMQVFAFGDEFPILLHTDTTNSSTQADGVDTAMDDAAHGPNGWEVVLSGGARAALGSADLGTLAIRQGVLWTLYAYTPMAVVVVYGGAQGAITSRWVVNLAYVPSPTLDPQRRALVFSGLGGRMTYLWGDARLIPVEGGLLRTALARAIVAPCPTRVLEVVARPISAFSFSDESFEFEGYDSAQEEIRFTDRSGHYSLSLDAMVSQDGNLARGAPFRLRPLTRG